MEYDEYYMHAKCNKCGWKGQKGDLRSEKVFNTEGEFCGYIYHCPKCNEHDVTMDLKEDLMIVTDEYADGYISIMTDGEDVWTRFYSEVDGLYTSYEFRLSKDEIARMKAILDRVVSELERS